LRRELSSSFILLCNLKGFAKRLTLSGLNLLSFTSERLRRLNNSAIVAAQSD
jgi:hypothetical protein